MTQLKCLAAIRLSWVPTVGYRYSLISESALSAKFVYPVELVSSVSIALKKKKELIRWVVDGGGVYTDNHSGIM